MTYNASKIIQDGIEAADTDTLLKWLRNNRKLIADGEYDPHTERELLHRCQAHIRAIRAELRNDRHLGRLES